MNDFLNLFFIFFTYSFIGWIIETIYVTLREFVMYKKFKIANRGFLIGPYCPIYGLSCVLAISILSKYKDDLIVLFIVGMVLTSVLEYITSYFLEKLFNIRWWDYSIYPFNLNGRICLFNSFLFGLLSIFVIKYINPSIENFVYNIPNNTRYFISVVLLIVFIIDIIVSYNTINKIKKTFKTKIKKDSSDEINLKVRESLLKESKLLKRILNAFPNFKIINRFK